MLSLLVFRLLNGFDLLSQALSHRLLFFGFHDFVHYLIAIMEYK